MSEPPRGSHGSGYPSMLHPAEEENLRRWLGWALGAGNTHSVVVLSVPVVQQLFAEVDAARAGRPVMIGAPVPAYQMAKEAAQLAPDGEE